MRLFPRANTSRLYVTRKDGGRGSISVEDAVDQSILGLKNYVPKNTETLHSAVRVTEELVRITPGLTIKGSLLHG